MILMDDNNKMYNVRIGGSLIFNRKKAHWIQIKWVENSILSEETAETRKLI